MREDEAMQMQTSIAPAGCAADASLPDAPVACVNGVPLHAPGQAPDAATLRQRASAELLRQAAQRAGLLADDDAATDDGVLSLAASEAIERLLDQALVLPEADDSALRRHHAAQAALHSQDERLRVRHVLFAVTPGVPLPALRLRAEQLLLELRCDASDGRGQPGDLFAQRAKALSNCPSGAQGGELGWLSVSDCAPELARELFGHPEVGVLPRLVASRFGLHVVEVQQRQAGRALPYEAVTQAVRASLRQHSWTTALRQYLQLLAGQARLEGVSLDAADTPLVQ